MLTANIHAPIHNSTLLHRVHLLHDTHTMLRTNTLHSFSPILIILHRDELVEQCDVVRKKVHEGMLLPLDEERR